MLWLLPQILMITVAEVMINISVLKISFSQAPKSLKSLVMSFNMIMMAFGNIIDVVVIAALNGVISNRVTIAHIVEAGDTVQKLLCMQDKS